MSTSGFLHRSTLARPARPTQSDEINEFSDFGNSQHSNGLVAASRLSMIAQIDMTASGTIASTTVQTSRPMFGFLGGFPAPNPPASIIKPVIANGTETAIIVRISHHFKTFIGGLIRIRI